MPAKLRHILQLVTRLSLGAITLRTPVGSPGTPCKLQRREWTPRSSSSFAWAQQIPASLYAHVYPSHECSRTGGVQLSQVRDSTLSVQPLYCTLEIEEVVVEQWFMPKWRAYSWNVQGYNFLLIVPYGEGLWIGLIELSEWDGLGKNGWKMLFHCVKDTEHNMNGSPI
jgi:hypothetical protein